MACLISGKTQKAVVLPVVLERCNIRAVQNCQMLTLAQIRYITNLNHQRSSFEIAGQDLLWLEDFPMTAALSIQ